MSFAVLLLAIVNIFQAALIYTLRKDVDSIIRIMTLEKLMELGKKQKGE